MSDAPRAYYQADWSSAGLLPVARDFKPARVIVFTGAWKGIFAVHSWIVIKPAKASAWARYDVVGWGNPVRVDGRPPDRRRYGNTPVAIADISGPQAATLIPKIQTAVRAYRYHRRGDYRIWPGPIATPSPPPCCARCRSCAPSLPPNAIGCDYRAGLDGGRTDSGTGLEPNLNSLAALKVGWGEGIEIDMPGRRARPAPPRPEAARLRPDRPQIAGRARIGALGHMPFTAFCPHVFAARVARRRGPWQFRRRTNRGLLPHA
ncbi:MAG: DUF3750 domain-containing protein [Pseudolabrys sp.]